MRTKTGDRIAAILRSHQGAEDAISAPDICVALGWPQKRERTVRRIIHQQESLWPFLICSIPGKGYFIATTHDEILTHDNWLADLHAKTGQAWDRFRAKALTLGFRLDRRPNKRRIARAA